MKYSHHFQVRAPLSRVAAFHSDPSTMVAITPPPIRIEMHHAPERLLEGGQIGFTLWFGLLPIRWQLVISEVSESGFVDRLLSGPFTSWIHHHKFSPVNDETTAVIDQITLQLKPHLFWGPVGVAFLIGLPVLFAFRSWKTRRLLEEEPA